MAGRWQELADGVFRRRFRSLDLNVGLVIGERGSLVIDTRASHVEARTLRDEIARVTKQPTRWVVNTHRHWDHVLGNACFEHAAIWAHERCRELLLADPGGPVAAAGEWLGPDRAAEIDEIVVRPPDHVFAADAEIDLGGVRVALAYPGKGPHRVRHCRQDIWCGLRRRSPGAERSSIVRGCFPSVVAGDGP